MKKIAIPQTLAGLMVHLLGDAFGLPSAGSGPGPGRRRAMEREKSQRKRNQEVYGHLPPATPIWSPFIR